MEEKNKVRINKFLSELGYCSRREADKLLLEKRITINNKPAEMGAQVSSDDVVMVDGDELTVPKREKPVYIAFNKPVGIVCTTDTQNEKNNIVDYIGHDKRIFPIGRLDKDSDGLIFLTNNGDIVNKILRAGNQHDKEYIVSVNKPITAGFINGMADGVPILGTKTKKCTVEMINQYKFRIVLRQGLNRQIRRMAEYFGYRVTALTRVRIMNINLDMGVGKWRNFKEHEVEELHKLLAQSSNESASQPKAKKHNKPAGKSRKAPSGSKTSSGPKAASGSKARIGKSKPTGATSRKSQPRIGKSKPARQGGGNKRRR